MADVRFTATLPERQHDWLRQRAYTERRSMAEILRDIIDGAMGPEGGTSVRIIIVEAGTDYTERIGAFEAKLVGAEAEMVAQAAALVAERGYRVLTNAEGGCCEYMSADEGDYIAITVAPTPDPDADGLTRPIDLVGKTLRAALDLITEAGPESALDAAELEQVGRDLDEIVDRVYLLFIRCCGRVIRHSAGADGKPTEPGVEVETVSL